MKSKRVVQWEMMTEAKYSEAMMIELIMLVLKFLAFSCMQILKILHSRNKSRLKIF